MEGAQWVRRAGYDLIRFSGCRSPIVLYTHGSMAVYHVPTAVADPHTHAPAKGAPKDTNMHKGPNPEWREERASSRYFRLQLGDVEILQRVWSSVASGLYLHVSFCTLLLPPLNFLPSLSQQLRAAQLLCT